MTLIAEQIAPTPERLRRLGDRYNQSQRRNAPHTISKLWDRINLTGEEKTAVERFTAAFMTAQSCIAVNNFEQHSGAYGSRTFSDRLLDAITEHKQASQYVGLRHSATLAFAVLGDASLADIGKAALGDPKANVNRANGAGSLALKMAAEMLCRYYDRPG